MAFIRTKRLRGREYAYLVETYRDGAGAPPRQRVLAYLGPVRDVREEDVPLPHRAEATVQRWLREHAARPQRPAQTPVASVAEARAEVKAALVAGHRGVAEAAACSLLATLGARGFLDRVMLPLVDDLSVLWDAGRLTPAEASMLSRAVSEIGVRLRQHLRADAPTPARPLRVLIASPQGEPHGFALDLLECYVAAEGHDAVVVAGDVPAAHLAALAGSYRPHLVLLAATRPETAAAALRAARTVLDRHPQARVLIGGRAFQSLDETGHPNIVLAREGLRSLQAALAPGSAALAES